MADTQTRQLAHDLIDRMAPGQVSVVVSLLEIMLDPMARSLANALPEDEPISEEETHAVSVSRAWLDEHQPIPNEEILADLGLTSKDFERMSNTSLEPGQ